MTERTGITKEGVIVIVGDGLSVAGLRMFEAIDKLRNMTPPPAEIIVAAPPRREDIDFDIRPALLRERGQTAPRSPRQSFKKSSKR